jgi:hypothetical protein
MVAEKGLEIRVRRWNNDSVRYDDFSLRRSVTYARLEPSLQR